METREVIKGKCPLCNQPYTADNNRTRHHIFPRYWKKQGVYGRIQGITVEVCEKCHEEYNYTYPMHLQEPWKPAICLINWMQYCYSKGQEPLRLYPQLSDCFT